jgi:hypothetical protein
MDCVLLTAATNTSSSAYAVGQIMGLVVLVALAVWFVRRARERSQKRFQELAPAPPVIDEPPLSGRPLAVTEPPAVMKPPAIAGANGAAPAAAAESNGTELDCTHLEQELKVIYVKLGKPGAFAEAKEKVLDLARERFAEGTWNQDEALYKAYEVSLAEHRKYLAGQELG